MLESEQQATESRMEESRTLEQSIEEEVEFIEEEEEDEEEEEEEVEKKDMEDIMYQMSMKKLVKAIMKMQAAKGKPQKDGGGAILCARKKQ